MKLSCKAKGVLAPKIQLFRFSLDLELLAAIDLRFISLVNNYSSTQERIIARKLLEAFLG